MTIRLRRIVKLFNRYDHQSWKRRGEWLELMPGKAVTGSSDKPMAAEQWLLSELQFPEKLLRQLKANQGIQLAGDRLRLALFASQPIDVEPRWADVDVLYEDDFCLVMHKPAGMKLHPDGSRTDQAITLDHVVASYYEMNGIRRAFAMFIDWMRIQPDLSCMPKMLLPSPNWMKRCVAKRLAAIM